MATAASPHGAQVAPADSDRPGLNRRTLLRALAASGLSAALPGTAFGRASDQHDLKVEVAAYLERLARPDGGYAWWKDRPGSHLTPTFGAIGCFQVLGIDPPEPQRLAEFVRTRHPFWLKKLESELRVFEFQQVQSLVWLGADAPALRDQVRSWTRPTPYLRQYEQHGYPILQYELMAFLCRDLLGLPLDDLEPEFLAYLDSRRRDNGSFNNTPAADDGDGNILNTWWGLQALRTLDRHTERRAETVAWLRACQLPGGGFTHQPDAEFGGLDDVAYTWAAVRALALLGAEPVDRHGCVAYLASLASADGGFADRPGWSSNPLATYRALDALKTLGALDPAPLARRPAGSRRPALPDNLKVYSIQIESHGQGSPAEAVDLADSLRIHLWGAKNAAPGWIDRAQQIAEQRGVPVRFFVANEEYGTWVDVPGMGTYSHTSDIIAPAGSDFGPSLAAAGVVSWPEFRARRLDPLQKAGGRLVWQFGENEELTRIFLDDSLQRGGFAAISTFHFGNPDFTNSEPFLMRYRGQIPYIALQDAHGEEPWWFADMTTGFRTLFLAHEPTWGGWLDALRRNWTVAVRHDAVSRFETWMHGGSPEVIDFVNRHADAWRWWENPAIARPWVSIVAVRPSDRFESGRPDSGIVLRVRCAWENTTQGQPKRPLAELTRLLIDGKPVNPALVETHRARGGLTDHQHRFHLPDPSPGPHTAEAVARVIATGELVRRSIMFEVGPEAAG